MIYYTLDELRKTKNISNIIVSSESKEILDYADKMIKNISHNRVLDGSINLSKREDYFLQLKIPNNSHPEIQSDYFCILNVNSPLRTAEHIDWAVNTVKIFDLDSLISVDEELSNL